MTKIAIIGGGLSGLSTAWYLTKLKDVSITVFEADDRAGGKIQTTEEKGFLYEHGPNGFMDSRQEMVDFCLSLGLEEQVRCVLFQEVEEDHVLRLVRQRTRERLPDNHVPASASVL